MNRSVSLSLLLASGLGLSAAPAPVKDASNALDLARQLNEAFVQVADRASDSVVVIRIAYDPEKAMEKWYRENTDPNEEENPLNEYFRRRLEEQRQRRNEGRRNPVWSGQGSGVIIREDGYIMTNRHVVDEAEKVRVKLKDGTEFDATVRGKDAQSDIAVLKIDPKSTRLAVAKLGDSSRVRVGEFAIAIGTPFELDYSVTFGHVSAKGRSRLIPDPSMDQDFIQTDANINPGNSGGPLVNLNGEVIGINTMIRGMNTGIGFAVPINLAKQVAEGIILDGKFTRAWLGVSIAGLREDPDLRARIKGVEEGVLVRELVLDGPAAKSELRPDDVIVAVDGKSVGTSLELRNEIRTKRVGSTVNLDVVRTERDGKSKAIKIKVKPEAWPEPHPELAENRPAPKQSEPADLGVTVKPVSKELADLYGVEIRPGIIVTEVDKDSPAGRGGIRVGDIITEIDKSPVTNVRQFRDLTKKGDLSKGIILGLISRGISKSEVLKREKE